MSHNPVQIIARGARAAAEAAAADIDSDVLLEGATYSILEEDEDRDVWRIDAFPTSDEEVEALTARLAGHPGVTVKVEPQGHVVLIDGQMAFVLTESDTDVLRSQTLAQASGRFKDY